MLAWIDRTNDGLSWMPADGTSLPAKRGLRHIPLAGSEFRLPQPLDLAKGGMMARDPSAVAHVCPSVKPATKRQIRSTSNGAGF